MRKLAQELKSQDVVFLAVTKKYPTDEEWEKTKTVVKEYDLPFPIVLDEAGEVSDRYGVEGIPRTFIVDQDGMVRGDILGARGEEHLRTELAKVRR